MTQPSVNSSEEKLKHSAAVKKSSGQKPQLACYKKPTQRQTAVTGTVTLNQEAGETVFLKSRRRKCLTGLIYIVSLNKTCSSF